MGKIDEYYISKPEYKNLCNLATMFREQKTSNDIIKFIKRNRLDIDSQVPASQDNYIPIVAWATTHPRWEKLVKWLIKNGCNLAQKSDTLSLRLELLFICHQDFMAPLMVKTRIMSQGEDLHNQIIHVIYQRQIWRLDILSRLGLISSSDIKICLDKVDLVRLFDISIKHLQKEIISGSDKDIIDKMRLEIVNTYMVLWKRAVKFEDQVIETLVFRSIKFYFHELLEFLKSVKENLIHSSSVVYHDDMNPNLTAMFRFFYNDKHYALTCKVLGLSPDERLDPVRWCEMLVS